MKPCRCATSPTLRRVSLGVACASAEVTVIRVSGISPWRASDSASGKYLSCGAVAISIGAETRAADRSGESDSTTRLSAPGSCAKRSSKRAGSRLTRSACREAAAGPSDLQGASRRELSGSGDSGSRLSTARPRAQRVGRRVEDPDQRSCDADRQLGRHGVRVPSIRGPGTFRSSPASPPFRGR